MQRSDGRVVTALVTAPNVEVAERLARTLVEERLAACANIVPGVVSVYRWKGEIQRDGEVMMVIKTTAERADDLARRVAEEHPYDVPEVLVMPVDGGLAPYLEWVETEVAG